MTQGHQQGAPAAEEPQCHRQASPESEGMSQACDDSLVGWGGVCTAGSGKKTACSGWSRTVEAPDSKLPLDLGLSGATPWGSGPGLRPLLQGPETITERNNVTDSSFPTSEFCVVFMLQYSTCYLKKVNDPNLQRAPMENGTLKSICSNN